MQEDAPFTCLPDELIMQICEHLKPCRDDYDYDYDYPMMRALARVRMLSKRFDFLEKLYYLVFSEGGNNDEQAAVDWRGKPNGPVYLTLGDKMSGYLEHDPLTGARIKEKSVYSVLDLHTIVTNIHGINYFLPYRCSRDDVDVDAVIGDIILAAMPDESLKTAILRRVDGHRDDLRDLIIRTTPFPTLNIKIPGHIMDLFVVY